MSIVLSIMSLSSSYCIGEHPAASTSKSPSPSRSVNIVLAHKSWLSNTPSKSVSVCDGEQPLLLAISLVGVFGQESTLSLKPSMSVSLWSAAQPNPLIGTFGDVDGHWSNSSLMPSPSVSS